MTTSQTGTCLKSISGLLSIMKLTKTDLDGQI